MNKKVLVTGGAGYIGSHVVRQLGEAGYDVVVYDNCSTGSAKAVLHGELIIGDLADIDHLYQVFAKHQFSAVLHFAASLIVPESVAHPLDYYANNTCNTLNLLRCCSAMSVNQFIFSSTAAVYGEPKEIPVTESTPTQPINPYGRSKLMSEWILQDYGAVSPLRYVILRYFNVAGADPQGRQGSMSPKATHLIKVTCDAVLQRKPEVRIFGTDFPTPDGTGIRDYIHVEDLATAHLDALRYLEQGNDSQIFNCGYGQGYSVRQVIERVKAISGVDFSVIELERRLGDPACVTACADKIHKVLGWKPKYNDLDQIVFTTLAWEMQRENLREHPNFAKIKQEKLFSNPEIVGATLTE
ncbi:UDP-glucose 4-epimerase GalE [Brasilonema sp. CT11]|nr:UDP-glucose 4-epimerase GalE [Brasilonema sp. CT11]